MLKNSLFNFVAALVVVAAASHANARLRENCREQIQQYASQLRSISDSIQDPSGKMSEEEKTVLRSSLNSSVANAKIALTSFCGIVHRPTSPSDLWNGTAHAVWVGVDASEVDRQFDADFSGSGQ